MPETIQQSQIALGLELQVPEFIPDLDLESKIGEVMAQDLSTGKRGIILQICWGGPSTRPRP